MRGELSTPLDGPNHQRAVGVFDGNLQMFRLQPSAWFESNKSSLSYLSIKVEFSLFIKMTFFENISQMPVFTLYASLTKGFVLAVLPHRMFLSSSTTNFTQAETMPLALSTCRLEHNFEHL